MRKYLRNSVVNGASKDINGIIFRWLSSIIDIAFLKASVFF